MSNSFSIDNDVMLLSSFSAFDNTVNDGLLVSIILLRQKNFFRTICYTAPKSDIACVSSHYFDNGATLVGGRGISNLINSLHRSIDRGIKANGIICTGNIQVNGSGNADGVNA